jgi:GT2 family glycosyltransferase
VVDSPPGLWPAAARNVAAERASGDVLVFVDADVVVHDDAFARLRARLGAASAPAAVFGSYDDSPAARGTVSAFRNLLHHHVHQSSPGPAGTFWTGLGAVRRDVFLDAGGFDPALRYLEDVELGMRIVGAGARVELDPAIQGKHLKGWSLREMIATDVFERGVPWVGILMRARTPSSALNLGWRHRLSAAASLALAAAAVARKRRAAGVALAALLGLNMSFYALLARRGGPGLAVAGVPLHVLHHLASVAAVPLGAAKHAATRHDGGRSG